MVPQEVPTHPDPLIFHVTAVLFVPVTVAVNCCCPPTASAESVGETLTETLGAAWIVTVAVPDTTTSASEIALTVTVLGVGAVAGAVYKPWAVIWPQVMPLHPAPVTLQITTLLLVPVTVAENCTCAPGTTCTGLGETVTEITDAAFSWGGAPKTSAKQATIVSHFIGHRRFRVQKELRRYFFDTCCGAEPVWGGAGEFCATASC